MWVQGIMQEAEDTEAPFAYGGGSQCHLQGTPWGPGEEVGLPSWDAHFLRIREKQRDGTWCRILLWETPYRHTVESFEQLRLGEQCKNSSNNAWELLVFPGAEKLKMGFKAGGVGRKQFLSVWDQYFCFQIFQWNKTHKTFVLGQPEISS